MPKESEFYGKLTIPKLKAIGKEKGLNPAENKIFASFMKKRFPDAHDGEYASEWAERIKYKKACQDGDNKSKQALKEAGYKCENL